MSRTLRIPAPDRLLLLFVTAAVAVTACGGRPVLLEGVHARALAESLHVNFTKGVEAADRAVMADTDPASDAAAHDARTATDAAQKSADDLNGALDSLGYLEEAKELQQFATRFAELRKLDEEILPLAVENSNLKAQRLSFGESQRAVDDLSSALDAAAGHARTGGDASGAALRCLNAVLRIQALQARHIAEATDETMSAIEQQMDRESATAREQLARLTSLVGGTDRDVAAAHVTLDLFLDDNRSIVRMSRQNTNVRSLALSLGRKQVVAAECEAHLAAIDAALTAREQKAVR
jgi:hypothetical protein